MFSLEHLVCEVPSLDAAPGFRWYEIDGDDADAVRAAGGGASAGGEVIVATRREASAIHEMLPTATGGPATHLQFEIGNGKSGQAAVVAVRDRGLTPIPACHLAATPSTFSHLRRVGEDLAALGSPIVKVVFPASEDRHVRWAEQLLQDWPHDQVGLSLTPAGHRQGRVRAALAGSRLVFAPLVSTSERMSAFWYRQLIVSSTPGPKDC
ncbi:hypothetical protein [Actinoplanes sp. NPDC020271]|uniref:hypothetical protein n=1 Tax=Actinoplanes sp. NPDC020271 TaxID=3363896 RepID=UPI0037A347CE